MRIIQQTFIFNKNLTEGVRNATLLVNDDTKELFIRTMWFSFFTTYVKKPGVVKSVGKNLRAALIIYKKECVWQQ
jgi:hypothetical protein